MEMRYLSACQTILKFNWGVFSVVPQVGQKRINNARKIVCLDIETILIADRIYALFLALFQGLDSLWF